MRPMRKYKSKQPDATENATQYSVRASNTNDDTRNGSLYYFKSEINYTFCGAHLSDFFCLNAAYFRRRPRTANEACDATPRYLPSTETVNPRERQAEVMALASSQIHGIDTWTRDKSPRNYSPHMLV